MTETITIHGAAIPKLGFGTWQLKDAECEAAVGHALATGYRHVDTAQAYENEREVGRAIAESGVLRDEIFLTTKVWMSNMGSDRMVDSVRRSLGRLDVERVDLLLLHWPNPEHPFEEMIESLNACREAGLTAHVGVSNYTANQIERAAKASDAPLVCDQVEYHPFLSQRPVLDALERRSMALTAYSPIAQGGVFGNGTIRAIGERHGKSEAQVALRWLIQQERVIAIPRSSKSENIESNFAIFDFVLSGEEMAQISRLARPDGRMIDPEWAPDWDTA
jgi:2,5-diketo-D-gluconate reductase B